MLESLLEYEDESIHLHFVSGTRIWKQSWPAESASSLSIRNFENFHFLIADDLEALQLLTMQIQRLDAIDRQITAYRHTIMIHRNPSIIPCIISSHCISLYSIHTSSTEYYFVDISLPCHTIHVHSYPTLITSHHYLLIQTTKTSKPRHPSSIQNKNSIESHPQRPGQQYNFERMTPCLLSCTGI